MIVQAAYISGISGEQYDNYLEAGWFRGSSMMYRSEFVCVDRQLYSIINVRFPLGELKYGKSFRKIKRKNDELFRVEVGRPSITEEKERMYNLHKNKYKAFLHASLNDIIHGYFSQVKINTRELCVYHGNRLIAASYFDIGKKSIASIIGIYDQEYAAYSLGYYTMLKEMEWAKIKKKEWYYPGYVMDVPSAFDYKLRLGEPQWLTLEKKWESWSTYNKEHSKASFFRQKMKVLGDYLRSKGIIFKEKLYPYFTTGHIVDTRDELLKYPVFLDIRDGENRFAASYDIQRNVFLMIQVEATREYNTFLDLEMSEDYKNDDTYEMSVLKVHSVTPLFMNRNYEVNSEYWDTMEFRHGEPL